MTTTTDPIGGEHEGDIALACASLLVDELVRDGMRHACVSPGSRSTPIALALARHPDITLHVHLDERSSAFFGLGIAKATGDPVCVACTSGTAAAELLPAVVEASQSRTSLVLLTADRPPALRGTGANQTIDQRGLYGGFVRVEIETPLPSEGAGAAFREAGARLATAARDDPPGPVHANLPFRERLTPTGSPVAVADPGTITAAVGPAPAERSHDGEARAAEEAAGIVRESGRGVVLLGGRGHAGAIDDDLSLARRLGWPVFAEPTSGARLPGVALSSGPLLLSDEPWNAAHRPHTVVQIGAAPLARAARELAASAERLVVVPNGHLDPAPGLPAARVPTARALLDRIDEVPGDPAWAAAWRDADARVRAATDRLIDRWEEPFEGRIARDVAAGIEGTLVVASSMPIRDLDAFALPREGLRVLGNRGASGIDGFVSTALGVAAAEPGSPTYALAGDLSFLHDLGALAWSGRRAELDLVLIVVNNDGGVIFSFLDQTVLPEHEWLFTTPHGLDLRTICAAFGVGYERAERAADVMPAVRRAAQAGGVRIVEIPVDREENVRRHREVQEAARRALHAEL